VRVPKAKLSQLSQIDSSLSGTRSLRRSCKKLANGDLSSGSMMGGDHLSNTVFGGDGLPTYRTVEGYTYWFRPNATLTLAATAAADVLVLVVAYAVYRFKARLSSSLWTAPNDQPERLRLEGTRAQCLSDAAAVDLLGWTCRALAAFCFTASVFQLQFSMPSPLHLSSHPWSSVRLESSGATTASPMSATSLMCLFVGLLLAVIAGAHVFAARARRLLPAAPPRPPV
jgi:hypothetical protein